VSARGRPKGQPGATMELTGHPDHVLRHEPSACRRCCAGFRNPLDACGVAVNFVGTSSSLERGYEIRRSVIFLATAARWCVMSVSGSGSSDVVQKINEALGVRLLPRPPEDFDPVQASDRELLEYGYPVRPDIDLHPELHERWNRMMSRRMLFIEPQFAIAPDWVSRRQQDLVALTKESWSGIVARPSPDDPDDHVTNVRGQWTVPAVVSPKNYSGFYTCMTWVGIDGYGKRDNLRGQLLQAGTFQYGDGCGTYTSPWWEWWPGEYAKTIHNFHVGPGDVVFCSISVHSPNTAEIYMHNITTRIATAFGTLAPGDGVVIGNTAEWILETNQENGRPQVLAQFGDVYFDQCLAYTRNRKWLNSGQGDLLNQTDVNGEIIATTSRLTDHPFVVSYTAEP